MVEGARLWRRDHLDDPGAVARDDDRAEGLPLIARIAIALVILAACGKDKPKAIAPPREDPRVDWTKPVAHATHDLGGYAGSEACAKCHAQQYTTYQKHSMARTGMRRVEDVDQAWLGKLFAAGTAVVHAKSGYSYTPARKGGAFVVTEALLGPDGTAIASWDDPVTHVFSAGSYGLALYSRRGDRLIHLPIDYYAKAARWDLDPMAFGGNPRTSVALDTFCISCHSDEPAVRFADPLPGGIGCERCHGPSKRHVQTQDVADTQGLKNLPARRQIELCAQCHQSTQPILREGRDHFGYRAGEPLDGFRPNFVAEPPELDRVKLLDHAERLVRSACWRGAPDKLTCTTCHDPHVSSLEATDAYWEGKCMTCHTRDACTDTREHRAAMGDHCVTCHMRRGTTSNVPLVTITDHWIQKRPPPIRPGADDKPQRLVPWSQLIGQPVTDAAMPGLAVIADAEAGVPDPGMQRASSAIASAPSARLWQLLAGADLANKRIADAGRAFVSALRLQPDDASALLGYARVMLDENHPEEAQRALERMLAIDPEDVAALELLAMHLYRAGDQAHATELFRRAAATGRATAISYVGLATTDVAQRAHWIDLAFRAEPRDRWIVQHLDDKRRAVVGNDVGVTPASAWLPH